jgi:predicted transcriptional regulator
MADAIEIITYRSLVSYLRLDAAEATAKQKTLDFLVELTNGLINEEWRNPVTPVPTKVTLLALEVAADAYLRDPAAKPVSSITRSTDSTSRTERYAVPTVINAHQQVHLTRDQLARLNPRRRRTIRTHVPGIR